MLIKACVNGARPLGDHPRLSANPDDIAAEAAEAVAAGAQALHVHAKGDDGLDSLAPDHIARFIRAVRRACPRIPIGTTTGAWSAPDAATRVAAIEAWEVLPDFASVNWHEDGADAVAAALLDVGVAVEAGIWNTDGLRAWRKSAIRARCLRVLIELPDDPDAASLADPLIAGVQAAEPDLPLLLHGDGPTTWELVATAVQRGFDTRIGLEDTLEMPDGSIATGNADLVQAAVRLISPATHP